MYLPTCHRPKRASDVKAKGEETQSCSDLIEGITANPGSSFRFGWLSGGTLLLCFCTVSVVVVAAAAAVVVSLIPLYVCHFVLTVWADRWPGGLCPWRSSPQLSMRIVVISRGLQLSCVCGFDECAGVGFVLFALFHAIACCAVSWISQHAVFCQSYLSSFIMESPNNHHGFC